MCCADGTGVAKNEQEAVRYLKEAADQGHSLAQYYLGLSYANGTGVIKNEQEAVRYYKMAADQGDEDAQLLLSKASEGL